MSSFRLRCVDFQVARAALSSSTAKPWFCVVISTCAGLQVQHRLVRAAVAELELERLGAAGQAEQLVAQADAEDRLLAEHAADRVDRVVERLGIAGAVGEEDAVGLVRQHLLGRRRAGHDRHPAAHLDQVAGDVPLHAVVERDDVRIGRRGSAGSARVGSLRPRAEPLVPLARLVGHDLAHQVAADQAGAGLGLGDQAGVVEVGASRGRPSSPRGAQPADQGPRVDPLDADDAVLAAGSRRAIAVRAEVARRGG